METAGETSHEKEVYFIVNGPPPAVAAYSAFSGQFIAVIIGYLAYLLAVKTMVPKKTENASQH